MDLYLEKSRARNWSIDNQLGYRIMDYHIGVAVMPSGDYSWTLEDVDAFVYGYDVDENREQFIPEGHESDPFVFQEYRADNGFFQYLPGQFYNWYLFPTQSQ